MEPRWRIKEFAARTGVAEITLRAWERRYGLLSPERSDGGYRLYTAADERRIVSMQAHMRRGMAPAEAARAVLAESPLAGALPGDAAGIVEELLAAVSGYEAGRVDALLHAAFALGRPEAIRGVVLPALHEIGERWARRELTVAHEHFASHLFERRLLGQATGWEAGGGSLALLACPALEQHTLGLLCFGIALSDLGWRIAYLGADMPVGQVAQAAREMTPDAVVLAIARSARLTDNAGPLRELATERRVHVGGAGAHDESLPELGLIPLHGDPVSAAETVAAAA